jgi:uncharacterized membrane protein (DUF485 family)
VIPFTIKENTQEFVAKYLCDMSKAIATVGLASNFFGGLSWGWRIGLVLFAIAFLMTSVILINSKGEK